MVDGSRTLFLLITIHHLPSTTYDTVVSPDSRTAAHRRRLAVAGGGDGAISVAAGRAGDAVADALLGDRPVSIIRSRRRAAGHSRGGTGARDRSDLWQ